MRSLWSTNLAYHINMHLNSPLRICTPSNVHVCSQLGFPAFAVPWRLHSWFCHRQLSDMPSLRPRLRHFILILLQNDATCMIARSFAPFLTAIHAVVNSAVPQTVSHVSPTGVLLLLTVFTCSSIYYSLYPLYCSRAASFLHAAMQHLHRSGSIITNTACLCE